MSANTWRDFQKCISVPLSKLVILNQKSLDKAFEAFEFKHKSFFEEVTYWSGMHGEVMDKFSYVVNHTKKYLHFIN